MTWLGSVLLCAVAETGRPLVRTVALGDDDVTVSVVPQRPGTNLVHTTRAGLLINGVPAAARSGAPGGWAVLELPAGTRELSAEAGGDRRRLRLDLGGSRSSPASPPIWPARTDPSASRPWSPARSTVAS